MSSCRLPLCLSANCRRDEAVLAPPRHVVQAQASLAAVRAANRDQALQAVREARQALRELLGPTRDVRERQPRRCT